MSKPARTAHQLRFEGELTIYAAQEAFQRVQVALLDGGPVDLDLAELTELDSAGIQLLLLLKRELDNAGRKLRMVGLSQPAREVLKLLDLRSLFRS